MGTKENILIVIAARSGSKGLKNKNIIRLIDRPLIAYTIQQALKWGKAANIVCSTDSEKIARIARKYGAEVPFIRSKNLAGDKVAKMQVIRHALNRCEAVYNTIYNIIVDLDITAPIRKISDLDNCLKLFKKEKPKTLFSVVKAHRNPYFNMVERKEKGKIILCKPTKKTILARQNAPDVYDVNASIYFYNRDYLIDRRNKSVISDNSAIYVMNEISGVDIDNEITFKFIEFLIKERIWKSEV